MVPFGAREEDLARVESAIGARFPPWLRDRLAAENGFVIDDTAGVTGRRWRILPVQDRSNRKRQTKTADDIERATRIARATDRASTPGFGEPEPGTPFPADAVVIGVGSSPLERLALLPNVEDSSVLGLAVYRQMHFAPIAPLDVMLDALAPDPATYATDEVLPMFRYHPDPAATGAIKRSVLVCALCQRPRGWVLTAGNYGRDRVSVICPWCVADGSAAAAGASFNDSFPLFEAGLPDETVHEVTRLTPGFATFQQEQWQVHCNDAAAFIGELTKGEIATLSEHARAAAGITAQDLEDFETYDEGERIMGIFGFRCLHCGELLVWPDMD